MLAQGWLKHPFRVLYSSEACVFLAASSRLEGHLRAPMRNGGAKWPHMSQDPSARSLQQNLCIEVYAYVSCKNLSPMLVCWRVGGCCLVDYLSIYMIHVCINRHTYANACNKYFIDMHVCMYISIHTYTYSRKHAHILGNRGSHSLHA